MGGGEILKSKCVKLHVRIKWLIESKKSINWYSYIRVMFLECQGLYKYKTDIVVFQWRSLNA